MVGLIFAAWLLTLAVIAVGDALAVGIVLALAPARRHAPFRLASSGPPSAA